MTISGLSPLDKAQFENSAQWLTGLSAPCELDGKTFHQRLENHAIELSFRVGRDYFTGSLRALNEHRDEAFDLLRLAVTAGSFWRTVPAVVLRALA